MALAAEYDEMLDSCNQKIELANRDLMTRDQEIERLTKQVDLLSKERQELQLVITKQQQQQEQLQQRDTSVDKELVDLQAQLVSLQTSSSKSIVDLQIQLKQSNDESATLTASNVSSKALMDKQIDALTAQGKKDESQIAALKTRIAELETAAAAANLQVKESVLSSNTKANQDLIQDNAELARQIVELTKTNEQLQSHLVNLAKEFQTYKETSVASIANAEAKAAQQITQLQKERDTLSIKLDLANKETNKGLSSQNAPPLPPVPVASSSSTSSAAKPEDNEQAQALASLTNEYHVYKYTAENDLAVANDTANALRRANQLLQNEIDQLTEDFGVYKKTTEATIADIESLHAARYGCHVSCRYIHDIPVSFDKPSPPPERHYIISHLLDIYIL